MTFNALQPPYRAELCIPVSVRSTVYAVQPILIDWSVALGAKQLRFIERNRFCAISRESVAIGLVMAVETTVVDSMRQRDVRMERKSPPRGVGGREQIVTIAALVRERRVSQDWGELRGTNRLRATHLRFNVNGGLGGAFET